MKVIKCKVFRRGILLLCMSALIFLGACSSAPELSDQATALTQSGMGQIAFVGSDGNIYRIRPQGGNPTPVTTDAEQDNGRLRRYQNPTWDPSTAALAFIELMHHNDEGVEALVHVLPAGAQQSQVVFRNSESIPIYIDWSSQGSKLAILSSRLGESDLSLWVAEYSSMAQELDQGQPYYWDWSPDGASLLVHVGGSMAANPVDARLSLFHSIASEPEKLVQRPGSFRAPAYRPVQGGFLVALDRQGGSRLVLLDDQGQERSSLVELVDAAAFSWSPDGAKIAYVEGAGLDPASLGELIILNMEDDQVETKINSGLDSVAAFFWSPDGTKLAAFIPEIVEKRNDQLVSYSAQSASFALRLVLVDANSGEWVNLAQLQPTDDWLSVIAYHDQYQRSGTIWSPASDSIVFSSERTGGKPGVYIIKAEEGAQANLIAEGTVAFWSLSMGAELNQADE